MLTALFVIRTRLVFVLVSLWVVVGTVVVFVAIDDRSNGVTDDVCVGASAKGVSLSVGRLTTICFLHIHLNAFPNC